MKRRKFIKSAAIAGVILPAGFLKSSGSNFPGTGISDDSFSNSLSEILISKISEREIKIRPEEIDDILSNPGVGWQTMSRMANQDKNLPSWIPSRVSYFRWAWDRYEPEQGKIDTEFLDDYLKQSREAGQTLAFRVMTTYPGRKNYPDWLKNIGGKIDYVTVFIDGKNHTENPVPDFDDPLVLRVHIDFIKNLGAIYDGHPDLDHVDLGSLGWWGEWHLSGTKDVKMPSVETQKKIIDAYVDAFRKTPLVIPIGAGRFEMLKYAVELGVGWRADCFGDMNYHMPRYYTQALASNNALNAWKRAPVAWESCWEAKKWVAEKWPLRFIFNYGLALHGSVLNNKSATLPEGEEVKAEIIRFLKRLGYRFVLKELAHPAKVKAGKILDLNMKWQNTGSAPCYKPYRLAYKLSADSGTAKEEKVIAGNITADQWMPGDMVLNVQEYLKNPVDLPDGEIFNIKDSIALPGDLKPGKYRLSVGITGVDTIKPALQIANKGRDSNGWYPLSYITLTK